MEYFSLSFRAAQATLLPLPADSPGISQGWMVKSIDRNFLTNSEMSDRALNSALLSRCSIAR